MVLILLVIMKYLSDINFRGIWNINDIPSVRCNDSGMFRLNDESNMASGRNTSGGISSLLIRAFNSGSRVRSESTDMLETKTTRRDHSSRFGKCRYDRNFGCSLLAVLPMRFLYFNPQGVSIRRSLCRSFHSQKHTARLTSQKFTDEKEMLSCTTS